MNAGTHRSQKMHFLKVELLVLVSSLTKVPGSKLGSLKELGMILTAEASLQPLTDIFKVQTYNGYV